MRRLGVGDQPAAAAGSEEEAAEQVAEAEEDEDHDRRPRRPPGPSSRGALIWPHGPCVPQKVVRAGEDRHPAELRAQRDRPAHGRGRVPDAASPRRPLGGTASRAARPRARRRPAGPSPARGRRRCRSHARRGARARPRSRPRPCRRAPRRRRTSGAGLGDRRERLGQRARRRRGCGRRRGSAAGRRRRARSDRRAARRARAARALAAERIDRAAPPSAASSSATAALRLQVGTEAARATSSGGAGGASISRGAERSPRARAPARSTEVGSAPDHQRRARRAARRASRRAICSGVSPSHSVWSSPTEVSAVAVGGDHVGRVEPAAEPGLDHRDLDARRCGRRRTRSPIAASNWVIRAPSSSVRLDRGRSPSATSLGRPRERLRRRARAPPIRVRSRQRLVCGEMQAPADSPTPRAGPRSSPSPTTCRWCRRRAASASCAAARRAPRRARASARGRASSRPARARRGSARDRSSIRSAPRARPGSARASRARPRRPRPGALATKPSLRELALAALDLGPQLRAALLEALLDGLGVELVGGEDLHRTRRSRAPRRRRRAAEIEAGEPADHGRWLAGGVAPAQHRAGRRRRRARASGAGRGSSSIAPSDLGLGLGVDAARLRLGEGRDDELRPRGRAGSDQISSVTNGMIGWASASVRSST